MPEMLCEGKEWQSYDDGFKPCLRNYERECGYTTKIIKKDKKQAKLKCSIPTCSFALNLNCRKKDQVWYISRKSSNFDHECDITKHSVPVANPAQIINLVSEEFKLSNKLPSWGDMKAKAQACNVKVTKKVAYTARKMLKDTAWGTEEKEYGFLKPYLEELTRLNPGSHFFYEEDKDGHFVRCGFTVPFLSDFLLHAIPAQMHDMAHLRNQKYPGQLSHMVVQDGNHNILGVSWGLHQSENEEEWTTIMRSNRAVLESEQFPVKSIFLLGDADKGMNNASKEVFPECRSFRCIKHHAKNLASGLRASVEIRYFYTCATMAYMASEYAKHIDLIRTHRPDVHEAIIQADPTNFARTQVGISRFDLTTQSDAESINAKYVKERSLPRFDILQQIELSIMQTIQDRREQALARLAKVTPDTMQFSVTPWAQSNIHESLKYARTGYDVVVGDIPNTFAVYSLSDRRTRWLVELDSNTCSCGRFQEIQIPCVHALSVLTHVPNLPHTAWSLCHDVYKTETWAKCYARTLNPVDISKLLPLEGVKPPLYKTQRGRPKGSKRIRGADELLDRTPRICSNCNQLATHNSATCRNGPQQHSQVVDEPMVDI